MHIAFILTLGVISMPKVAEDKSIEVIKGAVRAIGKADVKEYYAMRTTGTLKDDNFTSQYIQSTCVTGGVRHEETWTTDSKLMRQTLVYDGKNGWINLNGDTKDCTAEQLRMIQDMSQRGIVQGLSNLLDKPKELKLLADVDIDGKPMFVIRVRAEGKDDVHMYFDKETLLLRRSTGKRLTPGGVLRSFVEEKLEYKNFNGLMRATKTIRRVEGVGDFVDCITKVEFLTSDNATLLFVKP